MSRRQLSTSRPPELARHIGEFVCVCGKTHEWDRAAVFEEGRYTDRLAAGFGSLRVCECGRQWNVHANTYLKEGGIVETRVYVRLAKDLEAEVAS